MNPDFILPPSPLILQKLGHHDADRQQEVGVNALLTSGNDERRIGMTRSIVEFKATQRLEREFLGENIPKLAKDGWLRAGGGCMTSAASIGIASTSTRKTSVTVTNPGARFK